MEAPKQDASELVEQLELIIKLRWAALVVGLSTLVALGIIGRLAFDIWPRAAIAVFAISYNLLAVWHVKVIRRSEAPHVGRRARLSTVVFSGFDFTALVAGIYYTDGLESPFLFMLLLYVLVSGVVFPSPVGYLVATATILLVAFINLLGPAPLISRAFPPNSSSLPAPWMLEVRPLSILLMLLGMSYLGVYVIGHVKTKLRRERQEVDRVLREREKTLAQLAGLQQIGTEITSLADLDTVLGLIVSKARDLFATDIAVLALREGETDSIVITVIEGEGSDSLKGTRLQSGQGMGGLVMVTGLPVIVLDYMNDPRLVNPVRNLVADAQIKSGVAVPLSVGLRRIGVLYVFNRQTTIFDARDADVLLALANQAAIAIENARLYSDLRQAALTDNLTGLYNSRHLQERLQAEMGRAIRSGGKLALIVADCDSLKGVNDHFGHQVGDRLLVQLASLFKNNVRLSDVVSRYGGDEFVILLPEADALDAEQVAERIRRTVEEMPFQVDGAAISITTSFGLAAYPEHAADEEDLLRKADNAMYRAKSLGKNRVCAFSLV